MRSIAKEKDYTHLLVIAVAIGIYYLGVDKVKDIHHSPVVQIGLVLLNLLFTIGFVSLFTYIYHRKVEWKAALFLFSYALIPTIIWFYLNTFFYVALPPPRGLTFLGKLFSVSFITLSVSLLAWKIILVYLAIRFTTKLKFFSIFYILAIYLAIVMPYSLVMYHLGFFRIPFL